MADLYPNWAALAAARTEGVDYTRTAVRPAGATWAAIAIHGGLIEAGTGPVARALAEARGMAFYEFEATLAANNADLHITSSNFDEPQALSLVGGAGRVISLHGYAGDPGVAHTLIGGLDAGLRDRVKARLEAAGFAVTVAASELTGTDPTNICNRGTSRAGVQIEMSRALRESFFPGGSLTLSSLRGTARTPAFHAYVAAIASATVLAYDGTLSRVRLTTTTPGLHDLFGRTVVDGWGVSESGQTWLTSGAATAFQVAAGTGRHIHTAANTSRWSLTGWASDVDVAATVATDSLAGGGGQFLALAARSTDDGATCYLARLEMSPTQQVILTLRKRSAGVETLLVQHTTGLTHAAGAGYRLRLQVVGGRLRARAWLAAAAEPTVWQLDHTDPSPITGSGRIGVRSILSSAYSGTLPVTVSVQDIVTYGTAVVERSADGVRWAAVRGGSGRDGTAGATLQVDDYEFPPGTPTQYRVRVYEPDSGATLWTEQDQITVTLDRVWLKSIAKPFLNRPVRVRDVSEVTRPSRIGVFNVVGRSLPVAVSDVRSGRRWTMLLRADTPQDASDLDLLAASGDTILIQAPTTGRLAAVPTGYVAVGDISEQVLPTVDLAMRVLSWPCAEVAPPGPDVVGSTATWQTVLNTYGTWADMLAAHSSWADVLELIGQPGDVVVP